MVPEQIFPALRALSKMYCGSPTWVDLYVQNAALHQNPRGPASRVHHLVTPLACLRWAGHPAAIGLSDYMRRVGVGQGGRTRRTRP